MAELYANAFPTTLAAPCTDVALTITVAGAAPAALQGGQFRVVIGSELLLVTAGANTTTWTVTRGVEGTTAAAHAAGASVANVLTAGSLGTVPFFNVRAYGAKGDVVNATDADLSYATDDTAAIQAAINAAAKGGTVWFPPGYYRVAGELTVTAEGTTLMGAGRSATTLLTTATDQDLITVSASHFRMTGLSLARSITGASTAGSALHLASGSYATVDNCTLAGTAGNGFYDTITTTDAHGWTITNCTISDPVRYGVRVRNVAVPDTGDSTILACVLDTGGSSSAAIRIESSGGLRVVDNKISHHAIGIDLQVVDGANTSVLVIVGNSIEAQTTAAIRLGRGGTTGLWGSVSITGNQMLCTANGDGIVYQEGAYNVGVSGNTLFGAAGHYGVDCQAASNMASINGNTFLNFGTGIRLATTAGLIGLGINAFLSVPVPVEDNVYASYQQGLVLHQYRVPVINLMSSATYRDVYRIDMDSVTGCRLDLVMEGTLDWGTGIVRAISKTVHRGAGGNCTLTAISDTAGGTAIDVNLDTTSTAGSVIVQVRRNSGAGGTRVDGALALSLMGHVQKVNVL